MTTPTTTKGSSMLTIHAPHEPCPPDTPYEWARRAARRLWPAVIPDYGSPAWHALPAADVRKTVAAVIAKGGER